MAPTALKGQLLVATPPLTDENFDRTVVFVLEHSPDDGALGVVLNRPAQTAVDEILPRWADLARDPSVFFFGGPVGLSGVIGLGRSDASVRGGRGWQPVLDTVGALDLESGSEDLDPPPTAVRLFAGHSGWTAGQLEAEIAAGGWFVCAAEPGDVFTDAPADLWSSVLRRQGGKLAVYSTIPADPSVN